MQTQIKDTPDQYLGSTLSLECSGNGRSAKHVRVEFMRTGRGEVLLQPIDTLTALPLRGHQVISSAAHACLSDGGADLAREALRLCGWKLMAEDHEFNNTDAHAVAAQ